MKGIKNLLGGLILVAILIILDREIGQEEPMSKRTTRKLWLAVALIFAFVATCFGGVMSAQDTPVFRIPLADGIIGTVACNQKGDLAIIISSRYNLDSAQLVRAIDHESVHIAQVRRIGSCLKADSVYRANPLASEIPAFCSELKHRLATENAIDVLTTFILYLQGSYAPELSIDEIADRVEKYCLGRKDDSS